MILENGISNQLGGFGLPSTKEREKDNGYTL